MTAHGKNDADNECTRMVRELLKKKSNNELAKMLNLNPRILSRWKHIGNISKANLAILRLAYAKWRYGFDDISCRNMTKADIDAAVRRERRNSLKESLKDKVRRAKFDDATTAAVLEMIDTTFRSKKPRTGGDKS